MGHYDSLVNEMTSGLRTQLGSLGPDRFVEHLNKSVSDEAVSNHLTAASGGRPVLIGNNIDFRLLHVHEKVEILAIRRGLPREEAHRVASEIEDMFRRIRGPIAADEKQLPTSLEINGIEEQGICPIRYEKGSEGEAQVMIGIGQQWIPYTEIFSSLNNHVSEIDSLDFNRQISGPSNQEALSSLCQFDYRGRTQKLVEDLKSWQDLASNAINIHSKQEAQRLSEQQFHDLHYRQELKPPDRRLNPPGRG